MKSKANMSFGINVSEGAPSSYYLAAGREEEEPEMELSTMLSAASSPRSANAYFTVLRRRPNCMPSY